MSRRIAFPVPPQALDRAWPRALPFIERAMAHDNGRMTAEDHLREIQSHNEQLWFGLDEDRLDMVAITKISVWPQMKVARFVLLAGDDFDGWWAFAKPMFREWAEREGCEEFEVGGRKAWLRKLPAGWTLDAIVMRAEVAHA